jgi:hypothetical protein
MKFKGAIQQAQEDTGRRLRVKPHTAIGNKKEG